MNVLDFEDVDPAYLDDLLHMADMYAHECTKQEEKFRWWQSNGCDYRWQDCQAAYELLKETGQYFELRQQWLKG